MPQADSLFASATFRIVTRHTVICLAYLAAVVVGTRHAREGMAEAFLAAAALLTHFLVAAGRLLWSLWRHDGLWRQRRVGVVTVGVLACMVMAMLSTR